MPSSFFEYGHPLNFILAVSAKELPKCARIQETDVAQNLVDYFLSLTVGRPFHRKDLGERT